MKNYLSNILIYIAALCGIIAFAGLFATPLMLEDTIKGTWSAYNVKAYMGEKILDTNEWLYKGTWFPIIGYVLPLLMSIFLIVESFKPSLDSKLAIINTILAILYFFCAVSVLLTKELWLSKNDYGEVYFIRNGLGPIMSGILSSLAGIILLIVTWMPGRKKIDYIEK